MNIKNPEAHALAREIAERSGLSLTEAVLVALREKRDALVRRETPEALAQVLLAYGRRLREVRSGGSSDTSDLYDETLGLPR